MSLPLYCSATFTAAITATAPPRLCPVKSNPYLGQREMALAMAFSSPSLVSLRQDLRNPPCSSHFLHRSSSQSIFLIMASVRKLLRLSEPRTTTTMDLRAASTPTTARMLLPSTWESTLKPGQQSGHLLLLWSSLVMLQMAEERQMDLAASALSQLYSAAARQISNKIRYLIMLY